jgi:hypothetical protein
MNKQLRYFSGISNETDAKTIINNAVDLTLAAMSRDFMHSGLVVRNDMEPSVYNAMKDDVRKAILSYCGSKAGIDEITESRHILNAFDNPTFESVYNAIITETLLGVMARTESSALSIFANQDVVDVGNSLTYEIETKGLPIAQRNSYGSNVTFLEGVARGAITVTPKVWSTGIAVDVIRMLKGDIDMGRELARVAMSLLYAQYNLAVGLVVNNTAITSTPLYRPTFSGENYVLTISYLQALNNAGVRAFGTIPALNKLGVTTTTAVGFQTQDEVIRTGYLGTAYGIPHVAIQQSTDFSSALGTTDADAQKLMLLPNDQIFLMPDVGDKPVKLVRENYIRVINTEPNANSVNRREYQYFMAFDAALATQAHFGIQKV